ncbi:Cytoplasmic GTPase/eEF2-like protein (ribosomal biogenesis) [Exophiala dermatitidis]|uniref:Ribosome assembly protein 1 n=1 Tax=Exophiala dermatitidis TaxID=5970 RepID=A0AAN6EM45_EXODE|nr:Cytoplasmic GTPase/eEF2-like protein (ribosomal biogenesis) [Exophiala dermatitidis]KAJ4507145.1 Cytoplasmic GTPase/eEF2-like protein (ribosomal biogenesis) [Exophiala dermatitidis]KAJ4517381.1 Cytoplasmic GTPase/eEF2-like protein (ribosomal biogenesis) [Exophiala dermatitidis]KAJ4548870.1 Cytoplasmic GTPase/eEF2-like protein (ribosomal biogenesis) [Exophiala dermatitidis]KAJ4550649.1 Cytoplasmic GTPase/eEF2-like protein (ribosomal biogenesis) [Exophiala dermatitidis]
MPAIAPSQLIALQSNAQNIRNICILAHVDHGKTSLSDSLIATNGIISPKMAGKIRYLDSRPDEQIRGITMESSAISLYFSMMRRQKENEELKKEEYLINLIDSPGHIDFSSEVSTASRLCDAAVVLVDAVEGVCSQTVTVLRQVWIEKLKPLLVINKIDRLITELKMSPAEAYSHLERVLEGVNAVIGGFFHGERMEEDLQWREKLDQKRAAREQQKQDVLSENASEGDFSQTFEEKDDEDLYFAPEKNNVIFASAIDGWAFTVRQFSGIYEKKLGIKRSVLEKVLWGDFYLDPKTKKVLGQKHLKGRNLKPLFVQLVLEPIWQAYDATVGINGSRGDSALLEKITKSLAINLPAHILRSRDPKAVLQALFAAWLPLSTAVLVSVIEYLPSPPNAQATRLPEMIDDLVSSKSIDPALKDAMINFDTSENAPVVAYVSKMVAIPESELPSKRRKLGTTLTADEARELARKKRAEIAKTQAEAEGSANVDSITNGLNTTRIGEEADEDESPEQPEDPEHLIGFARLFSGSLSVGDEVYVLPPKFNPAFPHASPEPKKVPITALYLLMGRSLEPLDKVPAGVVFGIEGLEGHILKTGTLCSQLEGGINLAGISTLSEPIVRVALEPTNPMDLNKMIKGLKLLERSDPCAVYEQMASGEHVILTAGELHLERCLKDLRERFARCDIQPGEPIVPYRETIVKAEEMEPPKNPELPRGTVIAVTASKTVSVRLRVRPLPKTVTEFLIKNSSTIRRLYAEKQAQEDVTKTSDEAAETAKDEAVDLGNETGNERGNLSLQEFRKQLQAAFDEVEEDKEAWQKIIPKICAFGPRRVGPNLFIDSTGTNACKRFLMEQPEARKNAETETETNGDQGEGEGKGEDEKFTRAAGQDFSDTIVYAFQLATSQGPLCREPMQGVAVFLEDISQQLPSESSDPAVESGRLTGELISAVREAIRSAFLDWSPRILLAMYSCTIQATPDVLGRVYSVLTRRRGAILSEALLEGTPYFTIEAKLPVAESFGFSEEIRKRTSGLAQPMLRFIGFEMLDDVDPFWVPRSEEELEDLGVHGERENVAKKYVDAVRKRKGLLVRGARGGRDAEKQKTLKTN